MATQKKETITSDAKRYALATVETASLGKSCVDDTLLYWDALKELARTDGLTENERLTRLNAIQGLVTAGHRFAYDMSSLMESEHRAHENAYGELIAKTGGA